MPIPRAASLTTFGLVVALSAPTRVVVLAGQTAVARPGDFNGDGSAELAVYSPLSSTWKIRGVGDGQFGLPGDVAVPADYNGDGIQDVAVWRRSTGTWLIQGQPEMQFGAAGDVPVPADYNGDGVAEPAFFRPYSHWLAAALCIKGAPDVCVEFVLARRASSDIPVPADYNGDGKAEPAIYRPSPGEDPEDPRGENAMWYVDGMSDVQWGALGDTPVPADYNGDGQADIAVYRSTATGSAWYVRGVGTWMFGGAGDIPLPQDLNGDGVAELVVYRPSSATWYVYFTGTGATQTIQFGAYGDVPALLPAYYQLRHPAGDADGDRADDFTIFRPADGMWWTRFSSGDNSAWATSTWQGIRWGTVGDIAVPGDYDGDGRMDPAIYRPSDGMLWARFSSGDNSTWATSTWQGWQIGLPGDTPVPGDYDGDGRADPAVFRAKVGWPPHLLVWSSSAGYSQTVMNVNLQNNWTAFQILVADFNGDGRADLGACQDSGRQWSTTYYILPWGITYWAGWSWKNFLDPVCFAADFDGDGRADLGVYAPATGQWAWMQSSMAYQTLGGGWYWGGLSGDVPVPGDYDGDGRADLAIYRPSDGMWWVLFSKSNYTTWEAVRWGTLDGDIAVP